MTYSSAKSKHSNDYLISESIRRTAKLVGSSTGLVQKVKRWALDHNRLEL